MASSNRITLTAETAITGNGATNSDAVQVNSSHTEIIATLVTTGYTDGDYDTVIQHSHDGNVWVNLATIPQAGGAGLKFVPFPVTGQLLYIRSITTASSVTTGATVEVSLFTNKNARGR